MTFYCHQASCRHKTEAHVSDLCCCRSSFPFISWSWRTKTAFLNEKDVVALPPSGFARLERCCLRTVCDGTMAPRPCRRSRQLEASDASSRSNAGLLWRQTREVPSPLSDRFTSGGEVGVGVGLDCTVQVFYSSPENIALTPDVAVRTTHKSKQCQVIISNPRRQELPPVGQLSSWSHECLVEESGKKLPHCIIQ